MAAPTNFLPSLGRHLAGAVGIVVLMAAAFWGIGSAGDGDGGDLVAAPSATASTPSGGPGSEDVGTPEPTGTGTAAPSPTTTGAPTEDGSPTEGGSTDAPAASIPPGEISIQVLDAVRIDGSTAAEDVAERLEADGYDVVVVNDASKVYDVTTVFYTAGFEDSARQIAAAYGFTKVEEKPDNLSDTVRVHLVVGRDRA